MGFNSIRFVWDLAAGQPAQHLSLQQLKGADSSDQDSEDVRQVREFLPPECAISCTAIRAAIARAGGDDPSAAAEYLLMLEFSESTDASCSPPDKGASAKRDKKVSRQASRHQAKDTQVCDAGDKIAQLGQQLLSV